MKHSIKAAAIGALAAFAFSAQAAMVTQWSYSVATQWVTSGVGAPTFSSGGGSQTVTSSMLSWGSSIGNADPALNSDRSGLKILNSPQNNTTGGLLTNDVLNPDLVATFQHVNNSISGSYATLLTASVLTTITLTPYAPSGSALAPMPLTFNINFTETPNTSGSCIPEATSVCDDIFVLTGGNLNQTFAYDGYTYFVSFLDMQSGPLTPLSPQACTTAGAPVNCLGFWTAEGASETVDFGIVISSTPMSVPEPGVLALVGLSLLGAAGASRRRRRN